MPDRQVVACDEVATVIPALRAWLEAWTQVA
jgi:hypothetical protein